MRNFFKKIYIFFHGTRLFNRRVPFFKKIYPFTLSPLSYLSLLSPMWQKLPYICNKFFYYNNLSITFLNYRTIEKSPTFFPSWPREAARLWSSPLREVNWWSFANSYLVQDIGMGCSMVPTLHFGGTYPHLTPIKIWHV